MEYKIIIYRLIKIEAYRSGLYSPTGIEEEMIYTFASIERALNKLTDIVYHYQHLVESVGAGMDYNFRIILTNEHEDKEFFRIELKNGD